MAQARKGSRRIVIDDRSYRWIVRRRPSYSQALGWSPLSLAIELDETVGQRLHIELDVVRPDSWIDPKPVSLTPAIVARLIREALQVGWKPEECGPVMLVHASLSGETAMTQREM
jgi:hypothetical protein